MEGCGEKMGGRGRRIHFSMAEYAERLLRETDEITPDNIGERILGIRSGSCDRVSLIAEAINAAILNKDFAKLQSIRASLMWVEEAPGYPKPYCKKLR